MSERVTTWGDLLERRMGRRFVGRRREIEPFRLNFLYTVPPALLFTVQGPPGIGKSALLAQYRDIAREHGFVTATAERCDTRLPGEFAIVHAMSALARQLSTAGIPLTTFGEVYREYTGALQRIEHDESAPGHVWDLFGGVADEDPWAVRAWDEYLVRTFPLRRSPLLKDPVGSLTERFVQDLNAWATVRRILLCFDDWQISVDHADHPFEAWIHALLAHGGLSMNIWFLMADRHPLPEGWEALSPITMSFDLQPFSRRESLSLLGDLSNMSEEVALQEASQAEGNPLWLTLLASSSDRAAPAEGVTPVESYVVSLEPVLRAAVLKCAAARWLDEGVISALVGDEAVARVMAWLKRTPLVTVCGAGWRFQPAVRAPLEALAVREGGATWEAAHQTLWAYYRQRSELYPEPQYLDQGWQRDHLEALYHNLIIGDDSTALNAAMRSFLHGVRRFYPWAGAVAETWADAVTTTCRGRTCDPPDAVQIWEQHVRDGWQALVSRDWSAIYAFADDALETEIWGPEVRQFLRALSQLAAGRLALPVEEESPPEAPLSVASGAGQDGSSEQEGAPTLPGMRSPAALRQLPEAPPSEACELPVEEGISAQSGVPLDELASDEVGADRALATVEEMAVEHCGYANTRLDEGAYDAAIEAYDQALALNPDYVAAYYNRGVAYTSIGALDSAIADFTRVIELDAEQVQAYRQRGLVFARKGEFDRAIADYDVVLRNSSPSSNGAGSNGGEAERVASVYYDRANAYFRLRSYGRAIEDYTEALARTPKHVEAYLNRGLSYAAQGDFPEALRDYNRAIALDPNRAIAYSHRGQAYAKLDRHTEALADYERALELNPRDAAVLNNRGLLYARIAAYPEAVEAYQRAMAIEPDWATPYYNAACAAALMGDPEHATIWLARAIGLREGYQAMALRDPDFNAIRDESRFRELVGLEDA